MKSQITLLAASSLMFLLPSCGYHPPSQTPVDNKYLLRAVHVKDRVIPDADSELMLSQAAGSVSQSLRKLAEIEQSNRPPLKAVKSPNPVVFGQGNVVSVDWTGPVEPLLNKIATAAKYKVVTLGQASVVPVIVSVHTENTPLADVLQDVIYQTQNNVNIFLDSKRRVIELRYPNA